MPEKSDETAPQARALTAALDEALVGLGDGDSAAAPGAADHRWLGIGLRLGLERPGQARQLLEMIADLAGHDADHAELAGGDAGASPPASSAIPVVSALLARAAALPPSERAGMGPEVTFGWAARLTRGQVLSLGRVVEDMLAAGAPADIGRGFGLTWDAGVRLPREERDAMFHDFTALEVTVGGVLAGHDLRTGEPAPRPSGLGGMFGQWFNRTRPEDTAAAAALEGSGELGRRGLVALWNAWVAMRYRSRIPRPTLELLIGPWVTVIGPLPGA